MTKQFETRMSRNRMFLNCFPRHSIVERDCFCFDFNICMSNEILNELATRMNRLNVLYHSIWITP